MTVKTMIVAAAASLTMMAGAATAATFSAGAGGAVVAAPTAPSTFGNDSPFSLDAVSGFLEYSGFLTSDLQLDVGGTLLGGTAVNSYMFYYNRESTSNSKPVDSITATFDFVGDILGFIVDEPKLALADPIVGIPGVTYEQFSARGFETGASDWVYDGVGAAPTNDHITWDGTSKSIDVFLRITQPGDWFRVITTPVDPNLSSVPLPAGAPLLLAGFGALAWMRRRKS